MWNDRYNTLHENTTDKQTYMKRTNYFRIHQNYTKKEVSCLIQWTLFITNMNKCKKRNVRYLDRCK